MTQKRKTRLRGAAGLYGLSSGEADGPSVTATSPGAQTQFGLILGVDIGAKGALALIDKSGNLLEVADMPVLRDGPKNRATVNAPLLAEIIYCGHATEAFVEYVSARPGEGSVAAFSFGRSSGVIEGVLAACGVPCKFITPASWKRAVGLTLASKDASRAEAIRCAGLTRATEATQ